MSAYKPPITGRFSVAFKQISPTALFHPGRPKSSASVSLWEINALTMDYNCLYQGVTAMSLRCQQDSTWLGF